MRTINIKDIQALSAMVAEIREEFGKGAVLAAGAAVMAASVDPAQGENAVMAGLAGPIAIGSSLIDHAAELQQRFQALALHCFGLRPMMGETDAGFLSRVASMSEAEMMAAMKRNGIRLI